MASSLGPADVRARLDHPVIDADGHFFEYLPEMTRYLVDDGIEGGLTDLMRFGSFDGARTWAAMTPEERVIERPPRTPWWGLPMANTLDFATANSPLLLYRRLDELGIDFAVCYPSVGLTFATLRPPELRRAACRSVNRYMADVFAGLGDRMTPVGVVPMFDPDEALEALEHAVSLGLKTVMLGGFALRDSPSGSGHWVDHLGIDSAHDYDPVWRFLVEHGLAAGFHSGSMGWTGRSSVSNFSYNHMGNFAGANEATAKSLFFAGVPHRHPDLRLAFLEGGVTWAVQFVADLVGHWEKRGPDGIGAYDPMALDGARFDALMAEHAGALRTHDGIGDILRRQFSTAETHEDFALSGVGGPDEIVELVSRGYAFGCEADDPLTGLAFDVDRLPGRRPLRAMFSSDIGHWDVPNMLDVLPELYEHIEHGWLDETAMRAFACDNAHRFYTDANPAFFAGTPLADHRRAD